MSRDIWVEYFDQETGTGGRGAVEMRIERGLIEIWVGTNFICSPDVLAAKDLSVALMAVADSMERG